MSTQHVLREKILQLIRQDRKRQFTEEVQIKDSNQVNHFTYRVFKLCQYQMERM